MGGRRRRRADETALQTYFRVAEIVAVADIPGSARCLQGVATFGELSQKCPNDAVQHE